MGVMCFFCAAAPHCTYLPPVMWADEMTNDDVYDPLAIYYNQPAAPPSLSSPRMRRASGFEDGF